MQKNLGIKAESTKDSVASGPLTNSKLSKTLQQLQWGHNFSQSLVWQDHLWSHGSSASNIFCLKDFQLSRTLSRQCQEHFLKHLLGQLSTEVGMSLWKLENPKILQCLTQEDEGMGTCKHREISRDFKHNLLESGSEWGRQVALQFLM